MTVSEKVIIFFLLELFVRETSHYEILDVIFRPLGTKANVEIPGDDGTSHIDKPHDLMQLSFSAFGEDFDFLLHRSVSPDLHQTKVEIHGNDGSNDSDILDFRSIYYEFENYTTSVHGYKNRFGQFEGFVTLRNSRTSYYVEPASLHFPGDPAVASKSIVHKEDEIFIGNSNQHIQSEYRHLLNNYAVNISKVAEAQDMKKKPFIFVFNLELVGLASFAKYKETGKEAAVYMYLHCKEADMRLRRIDFNSTKVRLIPRSMVIYPSTKIPTYPIKNEHEIPSTSIKKVYAQFRKNYEIKLDAAVAFTHTYYTSVGIATRNGSMCNRKHAYALVSTLGEKEARPLNSTFKIFSHMIGHLLGSRDDNTFGREECNPPSHIGDYTMKQGLPIIDLKRFSQCSIEDITKYLMLLKVDKTYISPEPHDSCGNGIREPEEECDCGPPEMCNTVDKCCTPKGGIGEDRECTYRRQKHRVCSPRDDACCTNDCKIRKAGSECDFGPDGCIVQECDGYFQHCTRFKKIASNEKPCFGREGICSYGSCNMSFCEKKNMPHCNCTGESACRICCEKPGNPPECVPAKDLGAFDGEDVFLPHGTECAKNRTCDISGICAFEGEIMQGQKKNILAYVFSVIAVLVVFSLVAFTIYRRRRNLMGHEGSSASPIARKAKIKSPFDVRKYHPEIKKKSSKKSRR